MHVSVPSLKISVCLVIWRVYRFHKREGQCLATIMLHKRAPIFPLALADFYLAKED